jgi:hypothetical protein
MRIVGEWLAGIDGVIRPIIRGHVRDVSGQLRSEQFLVDSGADRTVFSADFLHELQLTVQAPASGEALRGVGGAAASVLLDTALVLMTDDGRPVTLRGEFAAFTDPRATELSILGRDVLDTFDVIISRRRDEVLLLAQAHGYTIVQT